MKRSIPRFRQQPSGCGWTNPPRDQFNLQEIMLIRAVRDYRLQHPWTNDEPDRAERLHKAFKLAN